MPFMHSTRLRWRTLVFIGHAIVLFSLFALLGSGHPVSGSERDLRLDFDAGPVMTMAGDRNTLWLGTAKGLYKWVDVPNGSPQLVSEDTGTVRVLLIDTDTLWIGSENGLFRWDNPRKGGIPQLVTHSPTSVVKLVKIGERLLIGATGGLYILQLTATGEGHDSGIRGPIAVAGPFVNTFLPDSDMRVWLGTDEGLLRWDDADEEPARQPIGKNIKVSGLYKEGSTLLIGTQRGLIRWGVESAYTPEWMLQGAQIYNLYKDASTLLISTVNMGLFRLDNVHTGQPESIADHVVNSSRYYRNRNTLWMGAGAAAESALYRWNSQKEAQPQRITSLHTGRVHCFNQVGDTLLIGAEAGLFRIDGQATDWKADIEIINAPPKDIYTSNNLYIQWKVGNSGWHTTQEQTEYRVIVQDINKKEVAPNEFKVTGREEVTLPPLKKGTYNIYVQATDLNGKTDNSQPVEVAVYAEGADITRINLEQYLSSVIIVVLIILLLAVLTPRLISQLLKSDIPIINKIAPVFYASRFGRWKLYRKYCKTLLNRSDILYSAEHYIDLPFEAGGELSEGEKLADRFTQLPPATCVVVIAEGGRGKSTLCRYVAHRCITRRDLFGGKSLYPVVIDGLSYGGNMLKGIIGALKHGRAYVNEAIVEAQMLAGNLLVILDGYSEIRETYQGAASSEDLPEFIRQYPDTSFIITSRSNLPLSVHHTLNDPLVISLLDIDEKTEKLFLSQYLKRGSEEVDALIREIKMRFEGMPRIPLMLKLVATVYDKKGTVPENITTLYDEYIDYILRPEATRIAETSGLIYAIRYLVRETFLRSGGDHGFTRDRGVELLKLIKETLKDYEIQVSPIKLLRTLTNAGLYIEAGENLKFFHDSFESYFAAQVLRTDFNEGHTDLLRQCAVSKRLAETRRFLKELMKESDGWERLSNVMGWEAE